MPWAQPPVKPPKQHNHTRIIRTPTPRVSMWVWKITTCVCSIRIMFINPQARVHVKIALERLNFIRSVVSSLVIFWRHFDSQRFTENQQRSTAKRHAPIGHRTNKIHHKTNHIIKVVRFGTLWHRNWPKGNTHTPTQKHQRALELEWSEECIVSVCDGVVCV